MSNNGNNSKNSLSDKQLHAINYLIAGEDIQAIADALGIDRVTLWYWRKDPIFVAELNKRRTDLHDQINNKLQILASKSFDVLLNILENSEDERLLFNCVCYLLDRMDSSSVGYTEAEDIVRSREAYEELRIF